jgi:hypothetical protein
MSKLLTERPLLVSEVGGNFFADRGVSRSQSSRSPRAVISDFQTGVAAFYSKYLLLLRKSDIARNRTQTSGSAARNCDH